jgi:hypothetical protein
MSDDPPEPLEDLYVSDGQLVVEQSPDGDGWCTICDAVVLDTDMAAELRDWLTAWLERQ